MSEYIFKNTGSKKGRYVYLSPENSSLKFLSFARIILDEDINRVKLESKGNEVSLICLNGKGTISLNDKNYNLKQFDCIYIPKEKEYIITTDNKIDIAESFAPGDKNSEPVFISFNSIKNSEYFLNDGYESCKRETYKLIDKNIDASRLFCGITFGKPGNWTSWPPYKHPESEGIYLFINMPKPSFGIQMIYNNLENAEFIQPVFENDAVIISEGYHPNAAIPGYGINFLWMMASLNPKKDRSRESVEFQEEFLSGTK